MSERLDIILFAATGDVGKHCIKYMYKYLNQKKITWGIAGRSKAKIEKTLVDFRRTTGCELSNIPIILADASDYETLQYMTARARIIINFCGLSRLHHEPIVKACLETGTSHVDVSIDELYMEQIELKYHKAAHEKGIYVVSGCGFNCVCCDLGVLYTAQQFPGTLNSTEAYLQVSYDSTSKYFFSYATWDLVIEKMTLGYKKNYKDVHRKLHQNSTVPKCFPKLHKKSIHKSDFINSWVIPFEGEDPAAVSRTQRYLYEQKQLRPIQFHMFMGLNSFSNILIFIFFGLIIQLMAIFRTSRNLLLDYSNVFSMGCCAPKDVTSSERQRSTKFSMMFNGKGWKEKLSQPIDQYKNLPTESIACKISGSNPDYEFTCIAAVLAAVTILEEPRNLPQRGGVYSPGAMFCDTSYIKRLQESGGITFEVLKNA